MSQDLTSVFIHMANRMLGYNIVFAMLDSRKQ